MHARNRGPYRTPEAPLELDLDRIERRARIECTFAGSAVALVLLFFILALSTAGAQSVPIEDGSRESAHGAPASPRSQGDIEAGSVLDRTRLLTSALVRAVSVADGRSPVGHCRNAGPRIEGGDRWARCAARMRALARLFVEAGMVHRVDPWLLAAQASRESGLHPWAEGGAGEIGVMQLHPRGVGREVASLLARAGARERCERRVDACQRPVIDRAAAHLRRMIERHGSEERALAAYNTGRADSEAGAAYARRVLRRREQLHAWAREAAEGAGPSTAASSGQEGDPS